MTLKADRLNFLLNKGSDATKTDDVRGITNDVFYTYNNRKATDHTAQYENERIIGEVDPLTFSNSETVAFFESPASWGKAACWAWNGNKNYTGGNWPGLQCEYIGKAANGNKIWKWTCTVTGTPANIMFNDGVDNTEQKSNEYTFINGGYYTMSERTATGINIDDVFGREFKKNVKSTICLPFNISSKEAAQFDGKIYQLTGASDGVFTFKPCNSIEAFKPYVFIANSTAKCLSPFRTLRQCHSCNNWRLHLCRYNDQGDEGVNSRNILFYLYSSQRQLCQGKQQWRCRHSCLSLLLPDEVGCCRTCQDAVHQRIHWSEYTHLIRR